MKVEEIKPRASEGDIVELEGIVSHAQKPNEGEFGWSQFIGVKDSTGEQNCWIKLDSERDRVSKGSSIKIKGKLGEEYVDKKSKKLVRSINNCEFEVKGGSPKESSAKVNGYNGAKDNYWEKKFEWDKKVHFSIVRECAVKAVTELAKINPSKTFLIKVHTEKDYFEFADKIRDYICKKITSEDITKEFGGTKEERIEAAREAVGETEFRPASTLQKNKIFGYRDKEGWHKGMIESRYITKQEIRDIGSPDKLSVENASEWLGMWWGVGEEIGERAKREIENPRDENGTPLSELSGPEPLVKGDKTSLTKDILVDKVYALRRENFLSDDVKFKKEMGYNPKLEELSEEDLTKLKEILQHYHPKGWDKEEK